MSQDVSQEQLEAGRGYEALFVPALFEVWAKYLVDGAAVDEGSHVLDIACGTGVLARNALASVGPGGRVAGADPAPGMIAIADEIEPTINWVLCGAESLPFEDESFDFVFSQFGMMFFEDREKAAAEMFRVLKPGGSLAVAVWRTVEHNPAYEDVIAVLQKHVGTAAADALRMPFSLGNADEVVAALQSGGFTSVAVEFRVEQATFPNSRQMVEAELRGWLPLFDINLDEEKIEEVLVESDKTLGKYAGPNGQAVFPTSANIYTAQKA